MWICGSQTLNYKYIAIVSMAHTNQTIFRTLHALTLLPTISPTIFSVAFDFFKKAHFLVSFILKILPF
ncbi:hypothetical protein HMPREF1404_00433 [Helicobacter pylori GAM210Bi]|nr:hypothetical protein HMPREF1404_00433 [Helicobacter pylori GAM210Bi]